MKHPKEQGRPALRRRTTGVDGEPRDSMIWSLFREEYPTATAVTVAVEAFDAVGGRLL